MIKKPMVILTGPTAVGKTDLSIKLAKKINGAIISADSMQIYKYMDIGSAKIMPEEMDGVRHYLVDELMPEDDFNVYRFKEMAKLALAEIYENNQVPIIVGGTGFYIQGLLYDIAFEQQETDTAYREKLELYAKENGAHALHEMLLDIDPVSYEGIHENNVKRVIRALEYYKQTGEPISKHNENERKKESPYNFAYYVLNDIRENLYKRIDMRVDIMVDKGLVDEIKMLADMGYTDDMVSMQGIGYKEMLRYIKGDYSLEKAIDIIKQESRRFAKRQLTWFRRERDVVWIEKNLYDYNDDKILEFIIDDIQERGIIKYE